MRRPTAGSLRPGLGLILYCVVGVLCAVLVVNTLRVPTGFGARSYTAEFSDVGGLAPDSEVTIAGVRVGRVVEVSRLVGPDGAVTAEVDFEVDRDRELPRGVRASVRYGDMLGIRYLSLDPTSDGRPVTGGPDPLPAGSRIPLSDTTPPVDLTALVNGFKPLFDAIDPGRVNELSSTIVEAFQGDRRSMDALLSGIAEVSVDVVDRQEVYRRLTDNITALNTQLAGREADLARLVRGLDDVSAALEGTDGAELAALVERGNSTVASVARLLDESEPELRGTIDHSRVTLDSWVPHTDAFEEALGNAPRFARAVNRVTDHGGFLNLYMCNFTLMIDDWETSIFGYQNSGICR